MAVLLPFEIESSPPPKDNTATMFVSLYLVVLAFFILINSIALIEQARMKKALGSVQNTFSNNKSATPMQITQGGAGMELEVRGSVFFEPMERTAKEVIGLVGVEVLNIGNTLQIRVPSETLYLKNSPSLRPEALPFLNQLASELIRLHDSERVDMEFMIGGKEYAGTEVSVLGNLSLARAGALARGLEQGGVKPDVIYIGVDPEAPASVALITFLRRTFTHKANVTGTPKP